MRKSPLVPSYPNRVSTRPMNIKGRGTKRNSERETAMKRINLKSILASTLCFLMAVESVPAAPLAPMGTPPAFSIALPAALGFVTDSYAHAAAKSQAPDFVLIQNLHVNRSVQFALSKILGQLKRQNLLPKQIAVEGAAGPMDIASMQAYPNAKVRKAAVDYLV